MAVRQVVPGLYTIPLGPVNSFLIESTAGCTLIDTGLANSQDKVLEALASLNKLPSDIKNIVLTHGHPDHIGSFAALRKATGAKVHMHPLDAEIARTGQGFRPMKAAPGLITGIMFRLFVQTGVSVDGGPIDNLLEDGTELRFANNTRVLHAPGHCAGQVVLLWPRNGGVLIAADACSNMMGLGWSLGYEDLEEGRRSLQKLAALNFDVVCFGHGKPIIGNAAAKFRSKWR